MTYEEMWEIAYSIGYHQGRMEAEQQTTFMEADERFFLELLTKLPYSWHNTARMRRDAGLAEGANR